MALVADSGAGKSTLLQNFELSQRPTQHAVRRKIVYCYVDPFQDLRGIRAALLNALGVPYDPACRWQRNDPQHLVQTALAELGVRMVIFDEVNHLRNLPTKLEFAAWDYFKWISSVLRTSVVCAGISGFENAIRSDGQLATRFRIVQLPRWRVGPHFQVFLTAFERSLPLRRPTGLGRLDMQRAILHESGLLQQIPGVTQGVKLVIEHAAIAALRSGEERISLELLQAWREDLQPLEEAAYGDAPKKTGRADAKYTDPERDRNV